MKKVTRRWIAPEDAAENLVAMAQEVARSLNCRLHKLVVQPSMLFPTLTEVTAVYAFSAADV